ncbi:MAG: creatininase [Archangium gephyra]|uniref:Creatininase n=1 Tax=Archangium gephyra TaxID=48 RepID=A0A2W5U544_9BACT|nr:MAG: creatininase [Archangium gephyra]
MSLFDARSLSWPRVKALAETGAVALLPIGSTEAHGPHLPLSVDVVIAEEVCRRVASRLKTDTVVFPPVAYALTDFAAPFAGTVTLNADVARQLISGVLNGIASSGFSTIAVINHHLEPAHFRVVHEAAKSITSARVVVADHRRPPTGPQLGHEFMHGGAHAGQYETSLMLAAAPHLVDEAERAKLPDLEVSLVDAIKSGAKDFLQAGGPNAYFGAPQRATAEEGNRLFELLADAAANLIENKS